MKARARRTPSGGMPSQQRRLFLSSLRSYAIVLVVPFILCLLFYFLLLNEAKREAIQLNGQVLASAAGQVDIHLQEAGNVAREISANPTVRSFQWKTTAFDYPNAYRLIEVRNSLGNYALTQEFIDSYFLLFNNSALAMSNSFIYSYDDFFTQYLNLPPDEAAAVRQAVRDQALRTGLQPVRELQFLSKPAGRYLSMVEPLMDLGNGYVCIVIAEESITSLFDTINLADTGCAYVVNHAGEVITRTAGPLCDFDALSRAALDRVHASPDDADFTLSFPGGDMLVNRTYAPSSGLTYVCVQPLSAILTGVNLFRNILLGCFALALLVGLLLCLRQARHAATPMASLMEAVGLYAGDSKEALNTVRDIVTGLRSDNETLQRIASEHNLLLRSSYASRLLRGSFSSDAEALRLGQYIIPEYADFTTARVLLFHLSPQTGHDDEAVRLGLAGSMKVALREALDRVVDTTLTYDTDAETLALVLFNQDHAAIDALYARLRGGLTPAVRDSLSAYGGASCKPPLAHIARSFESARTTMAARLLSKAAPGEGIVWADRCASALQYFYPPDMRYRLTESVTHGMSADVEALLNELFHVNLVERPLKPQIFKLFVGDLIGTGVGCLPMLPNPVSDEEIGDRIDAIAKAPLRHQPQRILEYFGWLTASAETPQSDDALLIRRVTAYLTANYADSSLSLTSVAEAFEVNPSMLSTAFKQQTGKNLSTYLEDLRITEAQRLLRTTDWTINRIAEAVGYLSASTFCRAFRRNTGQNTSTYKTMTERRTQEGMSA